MRTIAALLLLLAAGDPGPTARTAPPLGAPSAFDLSADGETLEVAAGVRLRRAPDPTSAPLATFDGPVVLPVLERGAGWVRVRWAGWVGWVPADGREPDPPAASVPPARRQPRPESPGAEPTTLEEALRHLVDPLPPATLGPFALYTDSRRERLLSRLRSVAEPLAETYTRRFGLPLAHPRGAIVLYATEASYRAWAEASAVRRARGHARGGVASLFVGNEDAELLASLLVHEATHLLNRQAFDAELPAWLEEALASDLASCRIDPDGRLVLGSWGGTSSLHALTGRRREVWFQERGAVASRRLLLEAWRRRELPTLGELLALGPGEFGAAERPGLHYGQATALVRYLLDGERGTLADAFRGYLGGLAAGAPAETALLEASLGRSLAQLQRGFDRWLARQALVGTP